MNVTDVTKAWFALISASGTTNNISKRKYDFYWHSLLYLSVIFSLMVIRIRIIEFT